MKIKSDHNREVGTEIKVCKTDIAIDNGQPCSTEYTFEIWGRGVAGSEDFASAPSLPSP